MFEGAARTMVLGEVWRDFVAARAPLAADRIVVVPNATAQPTLPYVGGGERVHILFLGRIGDRKGVPQLGDALARMKHLDNWHATIAGDGHVEAAGLGAVQFEAELRDAGREAGEDAGQLGALAGLVLEPIDDVLQGRDALAVAVLDQELEAAGGAQALDRRRREDQHPGAADLPVDLLLELPG